MWFRRLAGWKETRNTQNATRIKAGELLFKKKRLNTIRIYWLTNTTNKRYTILTQPETSFGVLPHHQSGVGIESPVCRNISLNMFPPVILRWLVHSGAIVFQSYHSSEFQFASFAASPKFCFATPSSSATSVPSWVFWSLVIDFGRCIFKTKI